MIWLARVLSPILVAALGVLRPLFEPAGRALEQYAPGGAGPYREAKLTPPIDPYRPLDLDGGKMRAVRFTKFPTMSYGQFPAWVAVWVEVSGRFFWRRYRTRSAISEYGHVWYYRDSGRRLEPDRGTALEEAVRVLGIERKIEVASERGFNNMGKR